MGQPRPTLRARRSLETARRFSEEPAAGGKRPRSPRHTAEKQRRRRGNKKPRKENIRPAGPVDAPRCSARAAAKKGGRAGRAEGGPRTPRRGPPPRRRRPKKTRADPAGAATAHQV